MKMTICKECVINNVTHKILSLCDKCYLEHYKKIDKKIQERYQVKNPKKWNIWYKKNEIKLKEKSRKEYLKNKEEILEKNRQYYKNNKEKIKLINKQWREKNPDKSYISDKKYRLNNKEKINLYRKNLKIKNLQFKIRENLTSRIGITIRRQNGKKTYKSIKLLGCNIQHCIEHLNKTAPEKITVNDIGQYKYHIDHKKPCSSFDLTKESEQLKCFHYTNLQLLWWKDNLRKNNKIGAY